MIEKELGQWHYELQRWPYGESTDYDEFGPFPSLDAAARHLGKHHANPGGWMIQHHPDSVKGKEIAEQQAKYQQEQEARLEEYRRKKNKKA
jgi:hypothetical protein